MAWRRLTFPRIQTVGLIFTLLTVISAFSQSGQNLEDVGHAELSALLNRHLKSGQLLEAAPVLAEFRKRMLSGELPKRNLEKVSYYIGLGYLDGYSQTEGLHYLKEAAKEFQHYIDTFPRGADIHYVVINRVECHRGFRGIC